jgi:hypothetical protein
MEPTAINGHGINPPSWGSASLIARPGDGLHSADQTSRPHPAAHHRASVSSTGPSRPPRHRCRATEGPHAPARSGRPADSRLGKRLTGRDQVIGPGPRQLARSLLTGRGPLPARSRVLRGSHTTASKSAALPSAKVSVCPAKLAATGVRGEPLVHRPPRGEGRHGHILHQRGVTPVPGLYMLGLTWQHTRGSALPGWVESDAAFLAEQIARR